MTHIRRPDRFNRFKWEVYVEDRHGSDTAHMYFDTQAAAEAQAKRWNDEMSRTHVTIGAVAASYER